MRAARPVDGERRRHLHGAASDPDSIPRSSRTARAERSSPGRTIAAAAIGHLCPAGECERRWSSGRRMALPVCCGYGSQQISSDRLGWLGRSDRHVAGLSQFGRLRHLRPAGECERGCRRWSGGWELLSARRASDQTNPEITSDGSGGAIITWQDHRSGCTDDIYAQRVDASGAPQWTADGVAICTAASDSGMIPRSSRTAPAERSSRGRTIAAGAPTTSTPSGWMRAGYPSGRRTGSPSARPHTNQLVSPDHLGRLGRSDHHVAGLSQREHIRHLRPAGGCERDTPVDDGRGRHLHGGIRSDTPQIISDGSGGAIITWQDYRSGSIRHLRPAGGCERDTASGRRTGSLSAQRCIRPDSSPDHVGRLGRSDHYLAGLSQR